jgi:hypothetical protein
MFHLLPKIFSCLKYLNIGKYIKIFLNFFSGSGEKIVIPHFFNITSMGKKINFKKSFSNPG